MAREKYLPEDIIQYLRTFEIEQSKGLKIDEAAKKVEISYQTLCHVAGKKNSVGLEVIRPKD